MLYVAIRGLGSPVFGSWIRMVSYKSVVMRPEDVSFTSTGCIVAMSEMSPWMTRPPCCGVGDAAAVAVGAPLVAGPPGTHAVATSIVVAKTAMRTRAVRCVLVMNPPLAALASQP